MLFRSETYLIVADNGSSNYALTSTVYNTNYLSGVSVTVASGYVAPADVTDDMLWKFTKDGSSYDIMNGTNYLNRRGGTSGGLYVGSEGTNAESNWKYSDPGHFLYTTGSFYYDMYLAGASPGPYYFGQGVGVEGTIYLYKRVITPWAG